jgi:hypothetical protein
VALGVDVLLAWARSFPIRLRGRGPHPHRRSSSSAPTSCTVHRVTDMPASTMAPSSSGICQRTRPSSSRIAASHRSVLRLRPARRGSPSRANGSASSGVWARRFCSMSRAAPAVHVLSSWNVLSECVRWGQDLAARAGRVDRGQRVEVDVPADGRLADPGFATRSTASWTPLVRAASAARAGPDRRKEPRTTLRAGHAPPSPEADTPSMNRRCSARKMTSMGKTMIMPAAPIKV